MEVRGYRGGEGQNEIPAVEVALARYDDYGLLRCS